MVSGPVRNIQSTLSNKFEKMCFSLAFIIRKRCRRISEPFCVVSSSLNCFFFFFASSFTSHRTRNVARSFTHSLTNHTTWFTHTKGGRISCSADRELRSKEMTTKNILICNIIKCWDLNLEVFMRSIKAPLVAPYGSYLNCRRSTPNPPRNFWQKWWPMIEHKQYTYLLVYSRRRNKAAPGGGKMRRPYLLVFFHESWV